MDPKDLVFNCPVCFKYGATTFARLLTHIKYGHSFEPGFSVCCGIDGCATSYKNFASYERHLSRKHGGRYANVSAELHAQNDEQSITAPEQTQADQIMPVHQDNEAAVCYEENMQVDGQSHANEYDDERLAEVLGNFILQVREKQKLSIKSVNFFLDGMKRLLDLSQEKLGSQIRMKLQQAGIDISAVDGLETLLSGPNPFSQSMQVLKNENHQRQFFKNHFGLVEPVEYLLGRDSNGRKETYQYVPIIDTLRALLCHQDVLAEVMNGHKSVEVDGIMRDYCDGSIYKENNFFSENPNGLQIQLYCDDYQAANPLGNRVKRCKITGIYFVLGNLRPKHRSKLHVIQLAILCKASLVKKYGFAEILQPLIHDLKTLAEYGVQVEVNGESMSFKGCVTYLSGDNLACHSLGGYFESFIARRPCRYCRVTKDILRTAVNVDIFPMRTRSSYDRNTTLVEADSSLARTYGIKNRSPLNELPHFHVIDGLPPDLAHDLFEGVVPEILTHIICHFAREGLYTLDDLNQKLESFPYEGSDKTNKPLPMSTTVAAFTVKQTAAQTWCLLRLLPLLLGDMVPKGDPVWTVLLTLLECVDLICSEQQTRGSVAYLTVLVEQFLESYMHHFPEEHIRPKGHYFLHYAHLILKFGPLRHCWTLRFEAKHSYFKQVAGPLKNWRNLCFTLAKRHQLMQCMYNKKNEFLDASQMEEIGGKMLHISNLCDDIKCTFQKLIPEQDSIYTAEKVKLCGMTYERNCFVVLKVDGHDIDVGKILQIFIINGIARFWCRLWSVSHMNEHFHAYVLVEQHQRRLCIQDELADHYPLGAYTVEGDTCIVPKHRFQGEYVFSNCKHFELII